GNPLGHPRRVVEGQQDDRRRAEADPLGARRDVGEEGLRRGDRAALLRVVLVGPLGEVGLGVAEVLLRGAVEVEAALLCVDSLVDYVPVALLERRPSREVRLLHDPEPHPDGLPSDTKIGPDASMTVVVTLLFEADVELARRVEAEHAEAYRAVIATARRHGLRSHRRLYGEGEFMDVDEWKNIDGRQAFLQEAAPYLRELAEARGSPPPVAKVWHPADEEGGAE